MKLLQVKFKDTDDVEYGGIQLDNGDVICGCCGGVFAADEVGPLEEENEIEIVEVYDEWWVNLSDDIIG